MYTVQTWKTSWYIDAGGIGQQLPHNVVEYLDNVVIYMHNVDCFVAEINANNQQNGIIFLTHVCLLMPFFL